MSWVTGPRVCDDRGATVVEGALITPILFAFLLGIFEYGLIFRDYLTVGDSVGEAARTGAVQGNQTRYLSVGDDDVVGVNADYATVRALRNAMAGIPIGTIEGIIIYRADTPTSGSPLAQVPPACREGKASSTAAACNYYPARDAFEAVANGDNSYFVCSTGASACGWPAQARGDGPSVWDIDYFGVYIKVERPYISGLFGDTFVLESATIQRLEPGRLGDE